MKKPLLLATFLAISVIYATIYGVGQQVYRQTANDPQIQLAEDGAANTSGQSAALPISGTIDPSKSLAPFLITYDPSGMVLASSARIGGATPNLPAGVLQHTTSSHESRLTWQPASDVRVAAVVVRSKEGYVLAGRSLRETEQREEALLRMVALAWVITMIAGGLLLGWNNGRK